MWSIVSPKLPITLMISLTMSVLGKIRQQTLNTLQPRDFSDKISYAFQLATAQGPLCNEPIQGIAVFLEEVTVNTSTDDSSARDMLGRLTGEVIKSVQAGIKQGFLDWSPRLLLAMYSCEIQASSKSHFAELSSAC
jgi:ribosome assembly protein 1